MTRAKCVHFLPVQERLQVHTDKEHDMEENDDRVAI